MERFASALGFWPFRCDDCSHRYWRFSRSTPLMQHVALPARVPTSDAPPPRVTRSRRSRVPTPPSSATV